MNLLSYVFSLVRAKIQNSYLRIYLSASSRKYQLIIITLAPRDIRCDTYIHGLAIAVLYYYPSWLYILALVQWKKLINTSQRTCCGMLKWHINLTSLDYFWCFLYKYIGEIFAALDVYRRHCPVSAYLLSFFGHTLVPCFLHSYWHLDKTKHKWQSQKEPTYYFVAKNFIFECLLHGWTHFSAEITDTYGTLVSYSLALHLPGVAIWYTTKI